jgi:maltooligosyltrehalose trehalohydrolase
VIETEHGGSQVATEARPTMRGRWRADLPDLRHDDRYRVVVDGRPVVDPWARRLPDGTDGWAAHVDPAASGCVPPGTGGRPVRPQVDPQRVALYELHVGAFSEAGDLASVEARLDHLCELGITHLELMPIAQFPGDHGWGYDGIFWQAVHHAYGDPAALASLVDRAHERGLGIVLDVVFNHVGPGGDRHLDAFGPFFTDRHRTPWGAAINVDGPGSDDVRRTIFEAAAWWVGEVGVDGLRVDACHAIVDQSARHVLAELTDRVHALHPGALVIAESGLNDPRTVRPTDAGGWGFDADWADDLHHAVRTLVTDDRTAWLGDFGSVGDLAKALRRPYVHDGTWSPFRQRTFGAPAHDVAPHRFVVFAQNHDQVGNRPLGDRLPAEVRPLAQLLVLLSGFTPMVFMGDELDDDAPFCFFSDHRDDFLADATRAGRRAEFAEWMAATGDEVPDPQARDTFVRSKLSWRDDERARDAFDRHRALLAWRAALPLDEATITADEIARWVRVDRGELIVCASLATTPTIVPCPTGDVVVATDPRWRWVAASGDEPGGIELAPTSAVLVQLPADVERARRGAGPS